METATRANGIKGRVHYLSWFKVCTRLTSSTFLTLGLKTANQSLPSFLNSGGYVCRSSSSGHGDGVDTTGGGLSGPVDGGGGGGSGGCCGCDIGVEELGPSPNYRKSTF